MKVTDPSGIRRVEIVDVTGAPVVVGAEDYDTDHGGVQTDRGAGCNFRFASPCPQLSYGETLRATSLQAGRRKLLVRAIDAGGNVVERGPYEAEVVSPSDRGALNGGNATESGSVSVRFTRGNSRTRRTIGYLSKADVAGQLLNDAGQPITNARVAVLTRDIDDDDAKLRTYVTTDGEGRFSYRATAYASRLYQFAWTSHVNDVRFAANGYVTLLARATASLTPSPRSVRVGNRVTLYGRLAGKRPRRSVDIVAQGRAGQARELPHVRRRHDRPRRALPRLLPLPRPGLARAHVPVPDQDRARQRLRLLGRLLADREGEGPLRRLLAALAPLGAALALAAPSHAGTYDVHFCNSAGTVFDNKSWAALASPGIVVDTGCPGANQLIGIRVDAGTRSASGAIAGITFTSPAGTAITDFTLTRQLDYKNPVVSGTRPFFTLYQLGNVVFAGAGDYADATRTKLNAQRSWYGYPANEAHLAKANTTRASFPALDRLRQRLAHAAPARRLLPPQHGAVRGRPRRAHLQRLLRRQGDGLRPDAARDGLRRGLGPVLGRPARRLGPRDGLRRRQRGHRARRDRRRHRPGRPARGRRGELRRRLHLRGGRAAHRRGRHVLVPARQAVPRPQPGDAAAELAPGRAAAT